MDINLRAITSEYGMSVVNSIYRIAFLFHVCKCFFIKSFLASKCAQSVVVTRGVPDQIFQNPAGTGFSGKYFKNPAGFDRIFHVL